MSLSRPLFALLAAVVMAPLAAGAAEEDAGAYLAARSAVISGDYSDAAIWFTRALIADPSNLVLLEGALFGKLSMGDFDGATPIADRMIELGAKSQAANTARAADEAMRGAFEDMLADQAAGHTTNEAVDALTSAWAEVGAGRMTDALAGFDKIAATKGLEAFGLYHKALALASVGDFEGADKILSGDLRLQRRGVIAHAQILSQLERGADAKALLDKAFGTEQDPIVDALRARLDAGETLPFDIVRNAKDGLAEVYFTVASALDGEASDSFALIYARVASHLRPDHLDSILLTASLLQKRGQYALALASYDQVKPDNPAFYAAEIGRADVQAQMGDTDDAIKTLTALAQKRGDLMMVHLSLGDLLRKQERFGEAAAAYDKALAQVKTVDARHWVIYYSRGIANEREKNWTKADADFRKALELNPNQPLVLNYLGYSMVERGEKLDEALSMIQRAVAAQPDSGYIIDSLAWAYFTLGQYDKALEPMERASLLEPVDPIVTDHLGDIYWAVGRKLEAEFQWHRALSFGPADDQAKRIRLKIDKGLDAVLADEGAKPLDARRAAVEAAAGDAAAVTEGGATTGGGTVTDGN